MIRLDNYFDGNTRSDQELISDFDQQQADRRLIVYTITNQLATFAKAEGFTETQTRDAIELLFTTFAAEWSLYILVGSTAIITVLTDDETIGFLDTDVMGTDLRTRLINRLT